MTYINIDEVQYLSDESVKYFISRLKNTLKHFVIDGETLTDESFVSFGDLKALIDLRISFCDNMESKGFLAISELSNLEWLKLRRAGNLLPQECTQILLHASSCAPSSFFGGSMGAFSLTYYHPKAYTKLSLKVQLVIQ